jgi:hypothetical protein
MAEIRIIRRGTEAKVLIDIKQVTMDDIDFKVELIYGYRRNIITIAKSDMQQDTKGGWFFMFDTTDIIGVVTARCTWMLNDTDCEDGERTKVDDQPLCFVADAACTKLFSCPCAKDESAVQYTFTDESDLASGYLRLCDCDGHPLATDDDYYLYVHADAVQLVQEAIDNTINNN